MAVKFISLFSGIGGLDLGLERAGMSCVAQVEIDPFCQKVLTKHWPDVPKFKDVRDVGKHNLPAADLICGGFPCQPHSYAGKRKASADERDLWSEFSRIIGECQPAWVVAENVPGLLSSEAGRFFGGVLRDLAASGYDAEWQSIPVAAFGAPHIRERVFILAHYTGARIGRISIPTRRPLEESIDVDGLGQRVLADTPEQHRAINRQETSEFGWSGEAIPDANSHQHEGNTHAEQRQGAEEIPANAISNGRQQSSEGPYGWFPIFGLHSGNGSRVERLGGEETERFWSVEPAVGRVAHGVPGRVDRLRGLGGAVTPQQAEFVGQCVVRANACLTPREPDYFSAGASGLQS